MSISDKEKIILLLNQMGTPFQDWCTDIAKSIKVDDRINYQILTEQPYTWPPSDGPLLGTPGSIDIIVVSLDISIPAARYSICLIVECKKANNEIKNWIFPEVDPRFRDQPYFILASLRQTAEGTDYPAFHPKSEIAFPTLNYPSISAHDSFVQGFEFNKELKVINKNQKEKMYNYLNQVNTGFRALISVDPFNKTILEILKKHQRMIFIPVLVTTADLYCVKLDPKNVKLPEGEIDPTQTELLKKNWLTYQFPLPDYLLRFKAIERMTTFIVNAAFWPEFLNSIQDVRVQIN